MVFQCILVFLGGYVSIITIFAYDTYKDNVILKRELDRVKGVSND